MKYFMIAIVFFLLLPPGALYAKKSKKNSKMPPAGVLAINRRFDLLTDEDKRKYDALSDEQKQTIMSGKIGLGFNEWMVELALGKPFYATEHHPVFVDFKQVWLYTRPLVTEDVSEDRIFDRPTNWPTLHRMTHKKTCNVSDFFVLWDRGVVQEVHKEIHPQVHGSCTIETEEAFLPIVNGKPVEPKAPL